MKLIDKVLIAATGIGAVALAVDYVRKRGEPQIEVYQCPYCHVEHKMTQMDFSIHFVQMKKQYER